MTEACARAVHEVGRLTLTEDGLQNWVDVRLERQDRLNAGGGLVLHTVIAEEARHRVVGSRAVMAEQLRQLVEIAQRPSVHIRVLPFDSGAHEGIHGPILVLRFPDPTQSDVLTATRRSAGTSSTISARWPNWRGSSPRCRHGRSPRIVLQSC
ncbi:DUF5753 domain-containing protein [Saccharopolyspora hordei]|uniref:DUF5753 domain-containing protein n=1 Tax=Saccharopolyspora hordei TaxID=1838 RepID=A0A853AI89_9PSEU|nr:DUF5753 domain-containing protein [Saccharopolyspora hordei]NYI83516.1 hypothetical protein [Saccharopolyspora hordei]